MCRRLRVLTLAIVLAGAGAEAATLQSAHATIEILGDGTCDVRMRFVMTSDAPTTSSHRLLVRESTVVDGVEVSGVDTGDMQRAGRSIVIPVSFKTGEAHYDAHYRVKQSVGDGWCGLLVPDAPTAGLARVVQIDAAFPAGVRRLPGEFPAMSWEQGRGSVKLGHVPAFARVPYAMGDEEVGWRRSFDVRTALDIAALGIIVGASVIWVASRRRRR